MSLGSSVFVRNAIEFDYCIEAAIDSVIPISDEVVVMDCFSDDGTTGLLLERYSEHPKVKLITNVVWEVGKGYERLRILADKAKSYLKTDWHFMIQADEVLHENSYDVIKELIKGPKKDYFIRRLNLWLDLDKYISFDSPAKPCGDIICRLAPIQNHAIGDAENLSSTGFNLSKITLLHYGFMRNNLAEKCKSMQSWFWESPDKVDPYILEILSTGAQFDYQKYEQSKYLIDLPFEHPKAALAWVAAHRKK